ncbi:MULTISPECIES: hypothetical protein [Kocuria]|uniref:hypothetical protein n=1 Tax=Kocuria TaxID=57493 RepID=UPI00203B4624|nr:MULTISPECIES: hypothetical protein [Kocuria]MCM3688420.1 hypothetical protein [Kocuria rosea]HST72473.1 hypothetical protein [Kocuria rosea]
MDLTGGTLQMELVFDRMLDSGEARGRTLSAFDAAAARLCAQHSDAPGEGAGAIPA